MKNLVPCFTDSSIFHLKYFSNNKAEKVYFPFFLREPFSLKDFDFVKLVDKEHLDLMREGKVIPLIFMSSECWKIFGHNRRTSPYFHVANHLTKAGIEEKNIVWLTCDMYSKPISIIKAKFIHFDYFLEQQKILNRDFLPLENIKYKFASFSRGVIRHHRLAMTYLLYKNKLTQDAKLSCCEYKEFKYITGDLTTSEYFKKLKNFDLESFQDFKKLLPINFDNDINLHQYGRDESHLLQDTFLNIINETHQPDDLTFITEKTYRTINLCRPFLINGDRHSLRYLKDMGFKTFDNFWDESYDDVDNDFDRLEKIVKILKFIDSRTKSQLMDMYEDMLPVLQHNHDVIRTLDQWHKLN